MGLNQGAIRLRRGAIREVTASEANRGYFFVTLDKSLNSMIKGKGIETVLNGMAIGRKATDSYGRILLGRAIIGKLEGHTARLKITGSKLVIDIE
jgi:hypothetical protein